MQVKKTGRGFSLIEFKDTKGEDCSIQKSSLADADYLWIGMDRAPAPHLGHELSPRMHIDQETAAQLIEVLTTFVNTGDICQQSESSTSPAW